MLDDELDRREREVRLQREELKLERDKKVNGILNIFDLIFFLIGSFFSFIWRIITSDAVKTLLKLGVIGFVLYIAGVLIYVNFIK